jgi:Lanthionine synthetase C-like protein
VGESAWSWVLGQVRGHDGPWLPDAVSSDTPVDPPGDRDSLYGGIAGLAPVLAEIRLHRPLTETEAALATGITDRLSVAAANRIEPSLYDGLGGDVTALRLLSPGREEVAMRRLAELRTPAGWITTLPTEYTGAFTDLVLGTAGIVLAAAWAGGPFAADVLTTGGEALLSVAEPTEAGLDWRMHPGSAGSMPNYSHGTAGVAAALAIAGHLLDRADFIEAARRGARHLLSVGWLDDGGFVIPHTLPYSKREVEPVTYSWCHGPTGTSHLYPALALAGVTEVDGINVGTLRQRCLHSVLTSGLPERLRPGFWDNDGRCCGTAGVGDVLLDAAQDAADPAHYELFLQAARTMGDALLDRAVRDETGARWQFIEYRQAEPLLPPGTSWMQGAAGIAAFLLRLARVIDHGRSAPVVDRPDQWWAVPQQIRIAKSDG